MVNIYKFTKPDLILNLSKQVCVVQKVFHINNKEDKLSSDFLTLTYIYINADVVSS